MTNTVATTVAQGSDSFSDRQGPGITLDRSPVNVATAMAVVQGRKPSRKKPARRQQPWKASERTRPTGYTRRLLLEATRWADPHDGTVARSLRQLAGDRLGRGAGIALATASHHLRIAEFHGLIEVLYRPDPAAPKGLRDVIKFRITDEGWLFAQVTAPFSPLRKMRTSALQSRACSYFAQRPSGLDNPAHDRWVRKASAYAIWIALADGPLTVHDLVERTGLSRRTVEYQRTWLADQGLCVVDGITLTRDEVEEADSFEVQQRRINRFEHDRFAFRQRLWWTGVIVLPDQRDRLLLAA